MPLVAAKNIKKVPKPLGFEVPFTNSYILRALPTVKLPLSSQLLPGSGSSRGDCGRDVPAHEDFGEES